MNNNETMKDNNGVMISFHTETSQSLNLYEDLNNFEDNNNDKNDNKSDGNEVNNKPYEKNNNDKKDLISCNSEKKF